MTSLSLAVIATSADKGQLADIHVLLSKMIGCLGTKYELASPNQASLALVWINSEQDLRIYTELREKFPSNRLIAMIHQSFSVSAYCCLPFAKLGSVPGLLATVHLFARVYAHFFPNTSATQEPFYPEAHLYGLVKKAQSDQIPRILKYADCPDVYLLPAENVFYLNTPIDQLLPMAIASLSEISITEVNDKQIFESVSYVKFSSRLSSYLFLEEDSLYQDINVKKYKRHTVNELLWFSALVGANGRLLADADPKNNPTLLTQFPEHLRLDYYGKEFRPIADVLCAKSATLDELVVETGRSRFEINSFYTACAAQELIKIGEAALNVVTKKSAARCMLASMFSDLPIAAKGRVKIVVAGSVGSGKTTAIASLSDFAPITTDTRPSDSITRKKSTTTVAMDYGEIRLAEHLKLFLYGTPGQKRFDFMSEMLCENAWGMLLLIDDTDPNPLEELAYYLQLFRPNLARLRLAIGITHCDDKAAKTPVLYKYRDHLKQLGHDFPVQAVDARDQDSLVGLLISLVPLAAEPLAA